ncbi:MAG: hypothetical protein JSV77_09675 [Dehalococcoidales bacterium]|nr:MAG: hypothetical protein JSV77_09675 [Dehalococcoidales bacterium]
MSLGYDWEYLKLGKFTYNVLSQSQIRPFLMEWLKREWEIDKNEFPDQPWSLEWLDILQRMDFSLEILQLQEIRLRQELMDYKSDTYNFSEELRKRANEREESLLRGVSMEPLVVNGDNMELMDGYTRYMVLRDYQEENVYAYVGRIR